MPKVSLKPPAWVPATASGYQSISWDLDNAYKAINELADQFAPGVLDNVQKQIAGPNGESIDFQKDIFGPWATASPWSATSRSRSPRRASGP